MIIRKPYAFLIKNFRKIHILLFVLCSFIYYKTITLNSFINQFLKLYTYDSYNEPISKYTGFFVMLILILLIVGFSSILILLKHKKKPWKLYLIPVISYVSLFITFLLVSSFFNSYVSGVEVTSVRALRDIVFILTFPQYITFIILLIRIFGVDLKKFDFKLDEEYLELSSEDREEVEISVDIDKHSFKRLLKKIERNAKYFYYEHKRLVLTVTSVLLVLIVVNLYKFIFVTNKVYKQGDVIQSSGYTIKINNSFYTDKDYKGDKISKKENFLILDLNIKNNIGRRVVNFNRFHVMNGSSNYVSTNKLYASYFIDLGTTLTKEVLNKGEEANMILIFKVAAKENKNRFVLYYQEFNNNNTNHLRKIKLKTKDLSKIIEHDPFKLGDVISVKEKGKEREIMFDDLLISEIMSYKKENCSSSFCSVEPYKVKAEKDMKILRLSFASNDFSGKDMIDFLSNYGKIVCIDNSNNIKMIPIRNALNTYEYYGKYVYIPVPKNVDDTKKLSLFITIRNNRYICDFK